MVLNSRILILDEATASVDYETDKKIQDTIATEFRDRTILCIARKCGECIDWYTALLNCCLDRLRTIIGYDRICVMDAGTIAEFDTPENLFLKTDGIFHGMCERSSITLDDITWAAKARPI